MNTPVALTANQITALKLIAKKPVIWDRRLVETIRSVHKVYPHLLDLYTPQQLVDEKTYPTDFLYDRERRFAYCGAYLTPSGRQLVASYASFPSLTLQ